MIQSLFNVFLYNIYRIQFKCKLCKDNNICYENVHHISVPEFKDAFFMVFIEFNLNVNCVKTITFVMEIFIIFLFQSSWMPSFAVFVEFNLNVNCKETITFVIKIFILFLLQGPWMPSFTVLIEFNLNLNCVKRQ